MGIYIKGMEMPTSGELLVIITPNGEVKYKKSVASMWDRTTVVPIPTHGRLGDLDELHKEAVRRVEKARTYDSWYNCTDRVISAFDIDNAPTVIPAEPKEGK